MSEATAEETKAALFAQLEDPNLSDAEIRRIERKLKILDQQT